MASIAISDASLSALKKALHAHYPEFRSSHLSEAIAAALGRKTHASLLADVNLHAEDPPIELLDDDRFFSRLQELGYGYDDEFSFEIMHPNVISTIPSSAYDIEYKSTRGLAWRNLMVLTINEAIRLKLLRPGDNRWPGATSSNGGDRGEGFLFDFNLPNGREVRAYVHDAGFEELSIHAAVNPKGDWVKSGNAGFYAGDAFATCWLERRRGAWMQSVDDLFNCRRTLHKSLAELDAAPLGYGDRGRVIM